MAHIRLDKIENGVFIIPLDRDSWHIDNGATPTPSSIIFNDDGSITLKTAIIKYKKERYDGIFNRGFKYIRFDYNSLSLPNDAIFCFGIAPWENGVYKGGSSYPPDGGWYYQNYMRTGTYTIMNFVNRTFISDGALYSQCSPGRLGTYQEITIGMNRPNNVTIRRVALADSVEKLKNLPKNY